MGIFCVCIICNQTVDFNRIKDASQHMICNKCVDVVPDHVPESQVYHWLRSKKQDKKTK